MQNRTRSLDVFRGLTVALMILVNNPGSWLHIYEPFEHAHWHGYTLTDLVFPFFLFAVGNAMAIVIPKLRLQGSSVFLSKVIKRTFVIFALGFILNWLPFFLWKGNELIFKSWTWVDIHGQLQGLRVFGVLQRVALAYGFAGLVLFAFEKHVLKTAFFILALNTILGFTFGAPHDPWSLEGFYGTGIDRFLLGNEHLYHGEGVAFDPEGLMSTLASVSQVLFGYWGGRQVLSFARARTESNALANLKKLILFALGLIVLGYLWSIVQPINKKIWTSSYTLVTTGYALLVLVFFEWKNVVAPFFEVFGKNPLFIYCMSIFIPRFLGLIRIPGGLNPDATPRFITPFNWYYENVCALIPGNPNTGSLVYACCIVIFYWCIGYFMDQKKIYIRV